MINRLWLSLRSEGLKSRRTLALTTTLLMPVLICGLFFLLFYFKSKDFASMGTNPWSILAFNIFNLCGVLILPMYAMVVAYSTNQVEHVANAWKNLFSLPYPKILIYLSKWIFALIMILAFTVLLCGLTFLTGNILAVVKPEIGFQDYYSYDLVSITYLKFFLAVIGLFSIQFLLSFYWRDFIRPVGTGLALTIAGAILAGWEYAYLFPYAETVRISSQFRKENMDILVPEVLVSLLSTLVLFAIGYVLVLRRSAR